MATKTHSSKTTPLPLGAALARLTDDFLGLRARDPNVVGVGSDANGLVVLLRVADSHARPKTYLGHKLSYLVVGEPRAQ